MKNELVLLASCLCLWGCSSSSSTQTASKAPECAVITVNPTNANLTNSYPATLKGKQDVEIRPMVSGFITKLHVDEGSTVRKGQVLFTIEQTQYQAAVTSAEAAVETAKASLGNMQLTYDNNVKLNQKNIISDYALEMSKNQLETAKAALSQAQAALTNAKRNLEYTNVTSPSDGIVGEVPYRVGALVSASIVTPLTTVSDYSSMYAYFSMSERQILELMKEHNSDNVLESMPEVSLQLIDGSFYAIPGKVETVSGVIDQSTGAVTCRALFQNPSKILRSGGTANVVFPNPLENIYVIPQSATSEVQDKKFVFVAQSDGTVRRTEIKVASVDDGQTYLVTEGLKSGDQVVIENVQNLVNGAQITPISAAQKESIYQQHLEDQRAGNLTSAFQ